MKIQIKVVEGIIPGGWEAVAFRVPIGGEWCIDKDGDLIQTMGFIGGPRLIVRQIIKKYDWSKTLDDVLVVCNTVSGYWCYSTPGGRQSQIAMHIWQPNIHGKCPVDPDASLVELSLSDGTIRKGRASDFGWAISSDEWHAAIIGWRFIGLADGYEW